ncbi:hypothetical protein EDB83DRAFT_2319412 [Lactarius deliciosus]|nr:hypothetical protein EDB83DRAFT_2319412 [Lactarius deliciosus]
MGRCGVCKCPVTCARDHDVLYSSAQNLTGFYWDSRSNKSRNSSRNLTVAATPKSCPQLDPQNLDGAHNMVRPPSESARSGKGGKERPTTIGKDWPARQGRVGMPIRGALGLSEPTWYIRLPPVSEDKGQYSMPRGGYRYPDRCAFRDHLGAYQSYDLPGELAGIARRGATPGRLVASGVSPASTALALRSHTHSGQPKRVTPFEAPAALSRPHVVPISEVISLWDPSAIRRSDSGKVANCRWLVACLTVLGVLVSPHMSHHRASVGASGACERVSVIAAVRCEEFSRNTRVGGA